MRSAEECGDIVRQNGDPEPDPEPEPAPAPEPAPEPEPETTDPVTTPVADVVDAVEGTVGVIGIVGGAIAAIGGVITVNPPLAGGGAAVAVGGFNLLVHALNRYVDRHHISCPTMNTPSGPLTFSAESGRSDPFSSRLTVLDALHACRCENNPIDQFKAGLPGPFGAPTCQLGDKLRCLREADNDVGGVRDIKCIRILKEDNQESLAKQLQACSVVNCGPDAMIGTDCSCHRVGGTDPGAGLNACETVTCPPDTVPVSTAFRCVCQALGGDVPGGNGGPIPWPVPIPQPIPR